MVLVLDLVCVCFPLRDDPPALWTILHFVPLVAAAIIITIIVIIVIFAIIVIIIVIIIIVTIIIIGWRAHEQSSMLCPFFGSWRLPTKGFITFLCNQFIRSAYFATDIFRA